MDRFIKLLVEKPLDRPVIRAWFNTVIENGPSGIVHSVTVEDDDGDRHVVRLVHQVMDSRHAYVIPIARDLQDNEIEHIVEQFAEQQPDLDFDVETNQTRLKAKESDTIPLNTAQHLALCNAFAKRQHEEWVRERTDAGWRYGVAYDPEEKVHPLLRPWDQLPDRYRVPDLSWPQKLVSTLNDNGYVVVRRDEFDDLLNKSR